MSAAAAQARQTNGRGTTPNRLFIHGAWRPGEAASGKATRVVPPDHLSFTASVSTWIPRPPRMAPIRSGFRDATRADSTHAGGIVTELDSGADSRPVGPTGREVSESSTRSVAVLVGLRARGHVERSTGDRETGQPGSPWGPLMARPVASYGPHTIGVVPGSPPVSVSIVPSKVISQKPDLRFPHIFFTQFARIFFMRSDLVSNA